MAKTVQDIMNLIQEQNIQMVDFKMVDIHGQFRHVTIPAKNFNEETMTNGIGFDASNYGYAVVEKSDMVVEGYYVDLKMSASPVAFQYDMAHFHEQAACYIFAKLAYIASVISTTFHFPSVFFTIAFLVFVWPSASSV